MVDHGSVITVQSLLMIQGVTIRYGSFLRFSIRPALVNFLYLGHELDESDLSNPQEFTKIYFWTGHKLMSRTGHLTCSKPYSFHIPQHSCRHVGQGNFRRSFLNGTFIVRPEVIPLVRCDAILLRFGA